MNTPSPRKEDVAAATAPMFWVDAADKICAKVEFQIDVTARKAAESIYLSVLESTQDYLRENVGFNLSSELSALRRDNESLRVALSAQTKALEQCRTSLCGYAITKSEQFPEVLASFWAEIQRVDTIARAALAGAK